MKRSIQYLAWLIILSVAAFGQPFAAWSQNQSRDEKDSSVSAQKAETIKWKFGVNEWRELEDWPDLRSREMTFYLSSEGPANGVASVGELVASPPGANDVLVYKTPPMSDPIEIGGPIDLDLHFSTSAKDTDFFASVVDLDEKGVMRLIGLPGKIRTRYLSGWEKPSLLQPDKVYKVTIALWDTAHQVKKGHRLGVVISSQMFPAYARNLNTGEPIKNATRIVAAHQTIYHDAKRPSAWRVRLLSQARKQVGSMKKQTEVSVEK